MQKQLSTLFEREMTRKEFMATLGLGAMTIMGFSSIVKLFGGDASPMKNLNKSSRGYGSGGYGN